MRAPAISSWAEKIFFVDWVERMRRRSARREPATSGALRRRDALGGSARLVVVVGQRTAVRRRELPVEALDGPLEAADRVVAERPRGADLVVDARLGAGDVVEE